MQRPPTSQQREALRCLSDAVAQSQRPVDLLDARVHRHAGRHGGNRWLLCAHTRLVAERASGRPPTPPGCGGGGRGGDGRRAPRAGSATRDKRRLFVILATSHAHVLFNTHKLANKQTRALTGNSPALQHVQTCQQTDPPTGWQRTNTRRSTREGSWPLRSRSTR